MAGRTFRVFVSSTFSDLAGERNALARWVFPRLRALCERRGYEFQAVDLRWGVGDEAAADQQTVRICLDEIARCQKLSPKPNFIVLLGDRYGWCPPPNAITVEDMQQLRPHLAVEADLFFGRGETIAEADEVTRTGWYRIDENAVPAEWVLQPRRGKYESYSVWEPVERRLRDAVTRAAAAVGVRLEQRQLHGASATELEIVKGALDVRDAVQHVIAFVRSIKNKEAVVAALPAEAAADLLDVRDGVWDPAAWAARAALEVTLREQLGAENVWSYEAEWKDGQLDRTAIGAPLPDIPPPDDVGFRPGTLCYEVFARLSAVIDGQIEELDKQNIDRLNLEQDAHADFAKRRREGFKGREKQLATIAEYLEGDVPRPLVVYAESGSGKSALMARAAELAYAAYPNALVIQRFIGAVPGSSEVRPLLEMLCRELSRGLGGDESTIDGSYEKLIDDFPRRLALARANRPALIFLDALDQLGENDNGRRLAWLPNELPAHVRVVVSTLPDDDRQCFPELRSRAKAGDLVEVEKLSVDDGGRALDGWLAALRPPRKLTAEQRAVVLEGLRHNGLPLYVKLAFEQARRWHSYDGVVEGGLPRDVPGIIRELYGRLSQRHGAVIVSRALGFLACSRYGLTDDEMLALLWLDDDVKDDFHRNKHHELPSGDDALPPIVWSRLYFDLEPYLAHRDVFGVGLLGFYHNQLSEVAKADHLARDNRMAKTHGQLADYFATRWRIPEVHALLEYVPQLLSASRSEEARALLSGYAWISAKISATDVDHLIGDYVEAVLTPDEPAALVHEAVRLARPVLAPRPQELVSQLLGRLGSLAEPSIESLLADAKSALVFPTLLPMWRCLRGPGSGLRRVLTSKLSKTAGRTSHFFYDSAVAVSPDGRTIASVSRESATIQVWDSSSGECLRILQSPGPRAAAVALSADARVGVVGTVDGTLYVWDLSLGGSARVLKTESGAIASVTLSRDGRFAVTATSSGGFGTSATIHHWNLERGELLRTFAAAASRTVALTPDGNFVITQSQSESGWNKKCKLGLWALSDGSLVSRFARMRSRIDDAVLTGDGRYAVTRSTEGVVHVWRLPSGKLWRKFRTKDHPAIIRALAVAPDNRTLVACFHRALRSWDLETGALLQTIPHSDEIGSLAISTSARGLFAVSASNAQAVKVWDLNAKADVRCPHSEGVSAVAIADGGTRILSMSVACEVGLWEAPSRKLLDMKKGVALDLPGFSIAMNSAGNRGVSELSRLGDHLFMHWDLSRNRLKLNRTFGGLVGPVAKDSKIGRKKAAAAIVHSAGLLKGSPASRLFLASVADLGGHWSAIRTVAISPDDRWLASGSDDTTVKVWELKSGQLVRTFKGHNSEVMSLAFAGNEALVAGCANGTLVHWDLATGNRVRAFSGHRRGILAIAIGSGREHLFSAAADDTVRLWHIPSGRLEREIHGFDFGVKRSPVAVTLSEKFVAVAAEDNTLKLWDATRATLLAAFTNDAPFHCVAMDPAGRFLSAGDSAGWVHLFALTPNPYAERESGLASRTPSAWTRWLRRWRSTTE